MLLFNLKPLFNQSIGTLFVGRTEPGEYVSLQKYLNERMKNSQFFRTLWIPTASRWVPFDYQHPYVNASDASSQTWNAFNTSGQAQAPLVQIMAPLNQNNGQKLLDLSSIRYLIVPMFQNYVDGEIYEYYGDRQLYIRALSSLNYLKKVNLGQANQLAVFENAGSLGHIYSSSKPLDINNGNINYHNVSYAYIDPSEYRLSLVVQRGQTINLNFSEAYDQNWRICIGKCSWLDMLFKKNYLPNSSHKKNQIGLNSFYINQATILKSTSKSSYRTGANGAMYLNVTLFYQPMIYFVYGSALSVATLVAVVLLIISRKLLVENRAKNEKI